MHTRKHTCDDGADADGADADAEGAARPLRLDKNKPAP